MLLVGLDVVFNMFLLPNRDPQAFLQLGIQDLFVEKCVGHVDDLNCPSELVLYFCSVDAVHVCFLQNGNVGASVLPADPQYPSYDL